MLLRFVLLGALTILPFQAQPVPARPEPVGLAHSQYFSGFVAEMTPTSIVVARKAPIERKTFLMDPQTKVEGKLRANVRVTVRFESTAIGDRAIRIIVRA